MDDEYIKELIDKASQLPLQKDQTMYLVSSKTRDGKNDDLLDEKGNLRPRLVEQTDFLLIDELTFNEISQKDPSIKAIPRQVHQTVSHGLLCEIYPLRFEVSLVGHESDKKEIGVSKFATVADLKELIREEYQIDEEFRLWTAFADEYQHYVLLKESDDQLESMKVVNDAYIIVDKKVDGAWSTDGTQYGKPVMLKKHVIPGSWQNDTLPTYSKKVEPGITGLNNLGNTCFMDSALQCLSNSAPLTKYFVTDGYKNDLNISNPLGMQGQIAEAYAQLIKQLWSGLHSSVAPRDFKYLIGKFAPQFVGYQQHDSQELLAFLLDGLHEDLNRVLKKPYLEVPDYKEGDDIAQFADKLWHIHKQRNDSIIVDNFQGQYKSTLICPDCSKVSITFDPFMYLTLPLPAERFRTFNFDYLPLFQGDWSFERHSLQVPQECTVKEAKLMLCQKFGVQGIALADVFRQEIYRTLNNEEQIRNLKDNDVIVAYALEQQVQAPKPAKSFQNDHVSKKVTDLDDIFYNSDDDLQVEVSDNDDKMVEDPKYVAVGVQFKEGASAFGTPCFLSVSVGATLEEFNQQVLHYIQQFTQQKVPIDLFKYSVAIKSGVFNNRDLESDEDLTKLLRTLNPLIVATMPDNEMFSQKYLIDRNTNMEDATVEKSDRKSITLAECFDEFSSTEKLSHEDAWYCPRCQEHKQASKQLELWRLPDLLVVHLKRFQHSRFRRDKIDTEVIYPIEGLSLKDSTGNSTYDLYAISNHFGGLGGGHYTAFCKGADGDWYDFDDSSVRRISKQQIQTSSAYLLFYKRRSQM